MPRTNVVLSICYTIWRWRMTMTSQRGQTGGCARQDTPRKFLSNRRSEGERDPYLHIHGLTRKHHARPSGSIAWSTSACAFLAASQAASAWVSHSVDLVICRMHLPEVRTKVALKRRQEWPVTCAGTSASYASSRRLSVP